MEKSQSQQQKQPNVLDYMNFREYLAAFYSYEKARNPKFSYGSFAQKAQIKTRNYLKRVIDGERPLSPENMARFSLALKLDAKSALYFEALVQYNQAKDQMIKNHYFQQLQKLGEDVANAQINISVSQYKVFEKWFILPIYESLTIKELQGNPTKIFKAFRGLVSQQEIRNALRVLESAKMIERCEDSGNYKKSIKQVSYSQDVINLAVQKFHRSMLRVTDKFIEEEKDIGNRYLEALSLVVPVGKEQEIKNKLDHFLNQLNNDYSVESSCGGTLLQINSQILTLSHPILEGEDI